jgi:hypothetical protein
MTAEEPASQGHTVIEKGAATSDRRSMAPSPSRLPTLIGWRGVSLRTPEDWTMTKVSTESANGYLRADSLEGYFVQIKWSEKKGVVSVPDSFDSYIRDLQNTAKKGRRQIEFKVKPRALAGVRRSQDAPITYSWVSDQKALGLIYHCGECNRLVIAEMVGPTNGDFSMAGPILASLREHGEGGWNTWGVHGLIAEVPDEFQLEKQTLVTGHVMLRFRSRSRLLILQQWGLANVALKGTDVAEWYEYQERNRLGRFAYRRDRSSFRGHDALRISGRDKIMPGIAKAVQQLSALTRPSLGFDACVWHCEETNRIYAISAEHRRGDDIFDRVLERLPCHGEFQHGGTQRHEGHKGERKGSKRR